MKTKQEVISFIESKLETKVICKGNPELDGQCVTLIKSVMEFLGVPNPYKARGHANTCISTYLSEGIADPGTGFLSVFSNKKMAGGYGHVWLNVGDGDGTYYESNGVKPLIVTKGKTYSYDNVCNFDKYIKEGDMSDEYGDMVWKSTQHDETVLALFDSSKDPRQTPSEEVVAVVNGYKSQATDTRNKLATAEQEVKNRTEQVSRLNEQLLNQEKAYNERLTALKLDAKSVEKLEQSYLGQIAVLTTRLDDEAKAKGRALLRVAVLEAENKDLKDRLTTPLSIRDLIRVIIKKLFKKG